MAICPNGHDSASDDFCDVCGMRIAASPGLGGTAGSTGGTGSMGSGGYGPAGGSPSGRHAAGSSPATGMPGTGLGAAGPGELCPRCGTLRVGQFCEACGYKFGAGQPPWAPAPPAPPPSGPASGSQPLASPWPPAPPPPSQPPPWPPAPPGPSGPSGPLGPSGSSGPSAAAAPSVPPAPSVQSIPSAQSIPSGRSMPSVPTAPPVSPTRPVASSYAPVTWTAVVSADRVYHEGVQAASGPDAASVPFPGYYAERRFRLTGGQMRIGRRSVSRGIDPEIDLTGPPADPGISRLHAVLIAVPDGSWAVLDPGSANGTLVNGTEIPTGVQVPLRDGDRINLGGWTAITVHRS
jgi:FHA domain